MTAGTSDVYDEDGQRWLRVSPGHAISEDWLDDNAPALYAEWRAATSTEARDQIALQIERLLEHDPPIASTDAAGGSRRRAQPTALTDGVARYEADAKRLSMMTLTYPSRRSAHIAYQIDGDALRCALQLTHKGAAREVLEQRLDAADLVADRPLIEAVSGLDVQVDRFVAIVARAGNMRAATAPTDGVGAEVIAEELHAALRAEQEVHDALRTWDRARDIAFLREWNAAVEHGDLEQTVDPRTVSAYHLEFGLEVDGGDQM